MADTWRDIVLKTIRETPSRTKQGAGFGLWIVQRVKNDKSFSVTVRSGSFYTDAVSGEKRLPKDGLNLYDFKALGPIYKADVEPLLNIPRDTPVDPRTEDDKPDQPEPEACPW